MQDDLVVRIAKIYEAGIRANGQAPYGEKELLATAEIVNLPDLAKQDQLAELVPEISRVVLYRSLQFYGPETVPEILQAMSPEQFTAVMDFAAWRGSSVDLFGASRWLRLLHDIDPELLFQRFSELEEEYQLALLGGMIRTYSSEEFETLADFEQDQLIAMPCQTLYYKILSDDRVIQHTIQDLVAASLSHNIRYAYALLNHAAFMPPLEQEQLLSQFRRARLEEDGFLAPELAQQYFLPQLLTVGDPGVSGVAAMQNSEEMPTKVGSERELSHAAAGKECFLDRVLAATSELERSEIQQRVRILVNALGSVSGMEPGDFAQFRLLLQQVKALLSWVLEILSQGEPARGGAILLAQAPKNLLQHLMGVLEKTRRQVLDILVTVSPLAKQTLTHFAQQKFGALLSQLERDLVDVLDLQQLETLKGLMNRFPLLAVSKAPVASKLGNEQGDTYEARVPFVAVDSVETYSELLFQVSEILAWLCLWQKSKVTNSLQRNMDQVLTSQVRVAVAATLAVQGTAQTEDGTREQLREILAEDQWDLLRFAGLGTCRERVFASIAAQLHRLADQLIKEGSSHGSAADS